MLEKKIESQRKFDYYYYHLRIIIFYLIKLNILIQLPDKLTLLVGSVLIFLILFKISQ